MIKSADVIMGWAWDNENQASRRLNALYAEFGNLPISAIQLVRPFGEHKYGNRQN